LEKGAACHHGLIAIGTVYIPISREIRNSLEKDLHWNTFLSRGTIIFFPPILIALGLNDFLAVVGLVADSSSARISSYRLRRRRALVLVRSKVLS